MAADDGEIEKPSRDLPSDLSQLAEQTPATRERFVDFLRAASILVVVLGHWLMAVVEVHQDHLRVGNVIAITPGLWALTWVLQVMPLFFFVGGFANAAALAPRKGARKSYSEWIRSRVTRLMRPVGLLLGLWLPIMLVLEQTSIDQKDLRRLTSLVSQPLWFIGVYLIVCAMAPPMLAWYQRSPVFSIAVMTVSAVMVDAVRFTRDFEAIGYLNFALVWLVAQQLGFAYHSGALRIVPRTVWVAIAGAAVAILGLLVTVGPYPASMVGLPGAKISNMAPPTVCLLALMGIQIALVMLLRDRATAWLSHSRPWKFTIGVNSMIMTIFCWHLTAAVAIVGLLRLLDVPFPDGGTPSWWATRPIWILGCAVVLAVLLWALGRFERGGLLAPSRTPLESRTLGSVLCAVAAVVFLIVGLLGVAGGGLTPMLETRTPILGFIAVSPISSLIEVAIGTVLALTPRR